MINKIQPTSLHDHLGKKWKFRSGKNQSFNMWFWSFKPSKITKIKHSLKTYKQLTLNTCWGSAHPHFRHKIASQLQRIVVKEDMWQNAPLTFWVQSEEVQIQTNWIQIKSLSSQETSSNFAAVLCISVQYHFIDILINKICIYLH